MIVLGKDNDTPVRKDVADGVCGICGATFVMHPMRNNFYCDGDCRSRAYAYYHCNSDPDLDDGSTE